MTEHTPTPWALMGRGDIIGVCKGFPQKPVAKVLGQETSEERTANIDLLIKAVNNHEAFLEMLREWLQFAEDKFGEFDIEGEDDCSSEKLCPSCESNGCIQRKIRLTRRLVGGSGQ